MVPSAWSSPDGVPSVGWSPDTGSIGKPSSFKRGVATAGAIAVAATITYYAMKPNKQEREKSESRLLKVWEEETLLLIDERSFEAVCERLEDLCHRNGIDPCTYPRALVRRQHRTGELSAILSLRFPSRAKQLRVWKNEAVKILYPHSTLFTDTLREVLDVAGTRHPSATSAVATVRMLKRRMEVLAERWGRQNNLPTNEDWTDKLLSVLPAGDEERIRLVLEDFAADFEVIAQKILLALHRRRQADSTPVRSATVFHQSSSTPASPIAREVSVLPIQENNEPPRPPKCFRCNMYGHRVAECPVPAASVHCDQCGEKGHSTNNHLSWDRSRNAVAGAIITQGRGGMNIKLKTGFENKREEHDTMIKHHEKGLKELDRKAAERRREKDAWQAAKNTADPVAEMNRLLRGVVPNQEVIDVETNTAEMEVNRASLSEKSLEVQGLILGEGRLVETAWLIDTGSDLNIMTEDLAKECGAVVTELNTMRIKGIGGAVLPADTILGQCEARVAIGDKRNPLMHDVPFVILKGGRNILGMPYLTDTGAQLDLRTKEITWDGMRGQPCTLEEAGIYTISANVETPTDIDWEQSKQLMTENAVVSPEGLESLNKILDDCRSVFESPTYGVMDVEPVDIVLNDDREVRVRPRDIPRKWRELVLKELDGMCEAGAWERVEYPSGYSSPLVIVAKKGTEEPRICIDFRAINNKVARRSTYRSPSVPDILRDLGFNRKLRSCGDLRKGYWQVRLTPKASEILTIGYLVDGRAHYLRPRVLQMGFIDSSSLFQQRVEEVVAGVHGALILIDDIIVSSYDEAAHLRDVRAWLESFRDRRAYMKPSKVSFFRDSLNIFGFICSQHGVRPDPERIDALSRMRAPQDESGVRRFLGMIGYFKGHITDYSLRAKGLTDLLRTEALDQAHYTDEQLAEAKKSFDDLVEGLKAHVTIQMPRYDVPLIIESDASTVAVGGVLLQEITGSDGKKEKAVLSMCSRKLTPGERKWPIRELELYALVHSMKKFEPFIINGSSLEARVDHESLRYVLNNDLPPISQKRVARWVMYLSSFDLIIKYLRGIDNEIADFLSRDVDGDSDDFTFQEVGVNMGGTDTPPDPNALPSLSDIIEAQDFATLQEEAKPIPIYKADDGAVKHKGRLVVPLPLRTGLSHYYHFGRGLFHSGQTKTLKKLKMMFWWPKMAEDIERTVSSCLVCRRRRTLITKQNPSGLHFGLCFNDVVAIDWKGPINYAGVRYYILVLIDLLTRFPEAVAVKHKEPSAPTAYTSARLLESTWTSRYGPMAHLICDNASHFEGEDLKIELEKIGICSIKIPPYHPTSNHAESWMKTLGKGLSIGQGLGIPIAEVLPLILYGYRSTPTFATALSPISMVFGYEARTPSLPDFEMQFPLEATSLGPVTREDNRVAMRRLLQGEALRCHLVRRLDALKDRPTRNRQRPKVGDMIIAPCLQSERARLHRLGNAKMKPFWTEPLRVIEVHPDMVKAESIWHKVPPRTIATDQIQVLRPDDMGADAVYASVVDLHNDYANHFPSGRVRVKRALGEWDSSLISEAHLPVAKRRAQEVLMELEKERSSTSQVSMVVLAGSRSPKESCGGVLLYHHSTPNQDIGPNCQSVEGSERGRVVRNHKGSN